MRRHNLRQLARVCYSEPEEPGLDEYVFCEKCRDFVFEYCSIHGPLLVLPDDKVPAVSPYPPCVPRAALTIPHLFLHIAPSVIPGAGLGVFSTLTLPRGLRLGPYVGIAAEESDSMYSWQIRDRNNKPSHVVDASDANASNWMRYVNCSRHWMEQNLVAYQYRGQIYYRTIKIIPRFTELMVFYGGQFALRLGVDLARYNAPAGYAQKYGVPVQKKCKVGQDTKTAVVPSQPELKQTGQPVLLSRQIDDLTTDDVTDATSNSRNKPSVVGSSTDSNNNKTSKHDKKVELAKRKDENQKKKFECSHCDKNFSLKGNLKRHIRTHTGEKPYQCNYCDKAFTDQTNLEGHIRTHTGQKPFKCNQCNKDFTQKTNLTKHIRIHTGEKPYQCNYCDKAFTVKSHLNYHIGTHTGEKLFKCSQCDKGFMQKINLTMHIRIHTGQKPYQCSYCGRDFNRKTHLTTHIRIHTGEKPYQCNYCDKDFNQKTHLTKHIRIHTGQKPYQCSYCDKAFTVKCSLNSHVRSRHSKENSKQRPT